MILNHAVRMEHVGPNLTSPSNLGLLTANFCKMFHLFFNLTFIKLGAKHFHRSIAVGNLRALLLAGNDYARWNMRNTYSRLCLVDVLSAGSACAVRIHLQILRTNLDLDRIINFWHDITGYEGRMATASRVEWRDAH